MSGQAKRTALAIAALASFVTLALPPLSGCDRSESVTATRRPNVVMISIDTLRADHLSSYGYARETSPAIDALAKRGVLFEQAYSQSPKTAVSHMSILTGLTPEAHGVRQWSQDAARRLSEEIPTLASLLQDAGYYTAAITGGGHMRPDLGFDRGMTFFQVVPEVQRAFRRAREVLLERAGGGDRLAPFFLFVHSYEVHAPYTPVGPYRRMFSAPDYQGGIVSSQRELVRAAAGDWGRQHEIFWQGVEAGSAADLQHLKDLYDASIRLTDHHIGAFLDWLDEAGVLDDTLVIVLSDHGEEFQEHGRFQHDQAYEELLHVPLVMAFPGPRGRAWRGLRERAVVRLLDVTPTVLDFLAVAAPDHLEGTSLLPLLSGGAAPPEIVVSSWPTPGIRTLRDGDWKWMERNAPAGSWARLFHLSNDPGESDDVAAREPERSQAMRAQLAAIEAEGRAYRAANAPGRAVKPDAETLENLRALGYIE